MAKASNTNKGLDIKGQGFVTYAPTEEMKNRKGPQTAAGKSKSRGAGAAERGAN